MSDWKESLPEGLRDAPFLSKADSAEDAAAKLAHAANHVGNSLRLPDKAASDEQVAEYRSKVMEKFPDLMPRPNEDNADEILAALGRPAEASEYTLEEASEDFLETARAEAAAAGLTKKQFEALYRPQIEAQQAMIDEQADQLASLERQWGEAYNDKVAAIKDMARETEAPQDLVEAIEQDLLPAGTLAWLDSRAQEWQKMTGESAQGRTRDQTQTARLTPQEAQLKAAELREDPRFWDPVDPASSMLRDRVVELEALAYPD